MKKEKKYAHNAGMDMPYIQMELVSIIAAIVKKPYTQKKKE